MRLIIGFVAGVIVGLATSFIVVHLLPTRAAIRFIESEMNEHEKDSVQAFTRHSSEASQVMQVHYRSFIMDAREVGLIDEDSYQEAMTIAQIRLGIGFADEGNSTLAEKTQAIVREDVESWGKGWSVDEIWRRSLYNRERLKITSSRQELFDNDHPPRSESN